MVVPAFSAAQMREDWARVWETPRDFTLGSQRWTEQAQVAGLNPLPPLSAVPLDPIGFREPACCARGAAGPDGWTGREFVQLARHVPWLVESLACLLGFCEKLMPRFVSLPGSSRWDFLFASRVAGIPKRKVDDSRPILVMNVCARVLSKCWLQAFPQYLLISGFVALVLALSVRLLHGLLVPYHAVLNLILLKPLTPCLMVLSMLLSFIMACLRSGWLAFCACGVLLGHVMSQVQLLSPFSP